MALSVALSWSPPPSSPLFDESTTPGGMSMTSETQGNSSHTLTDLPSSAPTSTPSSGQVSASSSAASELGRKSSPMGRQQQAPSPSNGHLFAHASPSRSGSTSPQPRSYAAAASHGDSQRSVGPQQLDMPIYPGAALTSSVSDKRSGIVSIDDRANMSAIFSLPPRRRCSLVPTAAVHLDGLHTNKE